VIVKINSLCVDITRIGCNVTDERWTLLVQHDLSHTRVGFEAFLATSVKILR